MNKKIISILTSGLLVSSLMVGCSSTDTGSDSNNTKTENSIEEEKHMTEEERIATLQGLEGDELVEAYGNLLNKDEINFLNEHGWKIEEEAKYYQDGLSLKTPKNYGGNEVEAEKYIAKQLDSIEKTYLDDGIFQSFEFTWTNNTGNDIDYLEIDFKEYDKNNACTPWSNVIENISAGETRKITLYLTEKSTEKIEITEVKIYHVPTNRPSEIYEGCIPGMWYKLEAQPTKGVIN